MNFDTLNSRILPPDELAMQRAKLRWNSIAKPLNGLGELEEICTRIAGLTGSDILSVQKSAVVVFCADNGVTSEGVTQTDASVTAVMAETIAKKQSSVCRMAKSAGAEVFPIDIGMFRRVNGVRDLHVADGTANIAEGPAMTQAEAIQAIETGITLTREYQAQGYELLAAGEMGIGNTTTSAALASVLLGLPVEQTAGRGAGLSDEGLARKYHIIRRAIERNSPNPDDALDVLCKLGGFDIAGMVGLFLGGALYRLPIIMDGLISSVSALIAAQLCPASTCAMIASHCSAEPAANAILKRLSLPAVLHGNLRLGEGTGAVLLIPLLHLALSVYNEAASFSDTGIVRYLPHDDNN